MIQPNSLTLTLPLLITGQNRLCQIASAPLGLSRGVLHLLRPQIPASFRSSRLDWKEMFSWLTLRWFSENLAIHDLQRWTSKSIRLSLCAEGRINGESQMSDLRLYLTFCVSGQLVHCPFSILSQVLQQKDNGGNLSRIQGKTFFRLFWRCPSKRQNPNFLFP